MELAPHGPGVYPFDLLAFERSSIGIGIGICIGLAARPWRESLDGARISQVM